MYNAGDYIPSRGFDFEALHRIRDMQSITRDENARKIIKDLNDVRKKENKPSPRSPILVSRNMKHLPKLPELYKLN